MPRAIERVNVIRVAAGRVESVSDRVACEAALEVRLHGEPFAVIMRTPGADRDLVAGFLFTEGVLTRAADVLTIDPGQPDVVDVTLAPGRATILPALVGTRRQVAMNSSCGMCGRRTLEPLDVGGTPLAVDWQVDPAVLVGLPAALGEAQPVFAETGGLHASALVDRAGRLVASAEDVGRHNAVDKLIGRMLLAGRLPLSDLVLFVSGRSSFEIVQKAFLAGIPLVAAVSAPSSLAINLARQTGVTLLGFVRAGRFNIYTHEARVAGQPHPPAAVEASLTRRA
jgi:FdhD protein